MSSTRSILQTPRTSSTCGQVRPPPTTRRLRGEGFSYTDWPPILVFSRCADSVEQGRRLENLSWRLWNRETFCCETGEDKLPSKPATVSASASATSTTAPKEIPDLRIPEVPQLSGSVDSAIEDEEAIEFSSESEPMEISRPRIVRQDSCASSRSRGRERHITSDHLEKMVVTIIQEKEPNLAPLPEMSSPSLDPESDDSQTAFSSPDTDTPTTPATEPMCHSLASETSRALQSDSTEVASSLTNSVGRTTVIRGFSPSHVSIPALRLMSQESMKAGLPSNPELQASTPSKPMQLKKQPAKFALGASSGDESSPQSLDQRRQTAAPLPKQKMFQLGASSGSADEDVPSLKSAMHSSRPHSLLNAQKKQTSFSNQISMRTIQNDSDQSGSYIDESAIDDDDEDSEWEDSIEESGRSSVDDQVSFKRVPSKANLTSQRSLISLMFAGQEQRAKAFGNHASQSTSALPRTRTMPQVPNLQTTATSPNDSDDSALEMKSGNRRTPLRPINEIPRSGAQPITSNAHATQRQSALSPRTTRRNMLATELTESLRRQLLWERQQKSSTANAVLKRRHTSHDVANLKQFPEKPYMGKEQPKQETPVNTGSMNQYLDRDTVGGYHSQGW